MTIDEAIKILSDSTDRRTTTFNEEFRAARKLGIEALKRCKVLAENSPLWATKPLPGETKE